ncbi:MAG: hypothetical protein EA397_20360 [Deltaproteobacteria bacterium]|nr:MAG: hypothetical protein EA397_20360 [Deltaproteobacteria bacterium]
MWENKIAERGRTTLRTAPWAQGVTFRFYEEAHEGGGLRHGPRFSPRQVGPLSVVTAVVGPRRRRRAHALLLLVLGLC